MYTERLPALLLLACVGCVAPRGDDRTAPPAPQHAHFVNAMGKPPPHLMQACQAIPAEARERVRFFAVNGADPLYFGNLDGLCACMKELGFPHCQCGQVWQCGAFRDRLIAIRRDDCKARLAVLGYSAGAVRVRRLAQELKGAGIAIDLLVYLGGDRIDNVPASRPSNVGQVLNITGHGYLPRGGDLICNGTNLDGATNQRLDSLHMMLPTRPQTVELLAMHLIAVAQGPDSAPTGSASLPN